MDLRLCGKVVLVTGSSRGIGLATAKAFAAEGCRVMLSARSAEQLRETEEALRATGAEVAAHAGDVGSPDDAARLIEVTVKAYGGIDILVNNVGGGGGGARVADSRIIRTVWIRLRSNAPRQSSSRLSATRAPPPPPPTLLTRMSMPP